jgi:hypothetical protein
VGRLDIEVTATFQHWPQSDAAGDDPGLRHADQNHSWLFGKNQNRCSTAGSKYLSDLAIKPSRESFEDLHTLAGPYSSAYRSVIDDTAFDEGSGG